MAELNLFNNPKQPVEPEEKKEVKLDLSVPKETTKEPEEVKLDLSGFLEEIEKDPTRKIVMNNLANPVYFGQSFEYLGL